MRRLDPPGGAIFVSIDAKKQKKNSKVSKISENTFQFACYLYYIVVQ